MMQRLGIPIVHDPELLVLTSPSALTRWSYTISGLDRRLQRGGQDRVPVLAQYPELEKVTDRVLIMVQGGWRRQWSGGTGKAPAEVEEIFVRAVKSGRRRRHEFPPYRRQDSRAYPPRELPNRFFAIFVIFAAVLIYASLPLGVMAQDEEARVGRLGLALMELIALATRCCPPPAITREIETKTIYLVSSGRSPSPPPAGQARGLCLSSALMIAA